MGQRDRGGTYQPYQRQYGMSRLIRVSGVQACRGKPPLTRPSFVSSTTVSNEHTYVEFLRVVLSAWNPGLPSFDVR
jgi:hypothetical protein